MSSLRAATESLHNSVNSIVETVSFLPEETLRRKPAPEVWSIVEILCHVEELIPYWAGEIQRVVAKPGVEWGRGIEDEARVHAVAVSAQRRTRDVVAGIRAGTVRAAAILEGLREEDLSIESPSRNPRYGVKPMSYVLDHMIVEHVRGHVGQIRRNLQQFQQADHSAGSSL